MKQIVLISLLSIIAFSCSQPVSYLDVDQFLDDWHKAAADADFNAYFSKMDTDAIYLGTQYDERWTKQEFATYAKPYFDRGRAWDFSAIDRHHYSSEDNQLIWFEETLKTWVGVCRGSGVIRNYGDSLRIIHYNLAVTISNDLVHDFVELVKKDSVNSFLLEN